MAQLRVVTEAARRLEEVKLWPERRERGQHQ